MDELYVNRILRILECQVNKLTPSQAADINKLVERKVNAPETIAEPDSPGRRKGAKD